MKNLLNRASLSLLVCLAPILPSAFAANAALSPGDILYVDSGNAIDGGVVMHVNAATGESSIVSSGGYLSMPLATAVSPSGGILVSDTSGRLINVDPNTSMQRVLADNARGKLGMPCGIALGSRGEVFIANAQSVLRFDANSGRTSVVSAGGLLQLPIWVAVADDGDLYVLDRGAVSGIVRVNPRTGAQSLVSSGEAFRSPQALTMSGDDIYVTDVATSDGNFGVGNVIHVDRRTGEQRIVSEGNFLAGPVGIAVDLAGQLIVADPYTVNPESADLYDGAIIRIDPATGTQELIARGRGGFVNPRGVTIVPELSSHARRR